MTVRYDIRQVTRYVLVRRAPTGDTDIAEYKRRDLAEQGRDMAEQAVRGMESMGPLCAPNHPVGDGVTDGIEALRSRAQQAASLQEIANKIQAERLAKAVDRRNADWLANAFMHSGWDGASAVLTALASGGSGNAQIDQKAALKVTSND